MRAFFKLTVVVFFTLLTVNLHTQEREGFYAAPLLEIVSYGQRAPAFGTGLLLGGGDGVFMGTRLMYASPFNEKDFPALEITVFLRTFILDTAVYKGLFIQLDGGIVIYSTESAMSVPEEAGSFSAGLSAGWRFLLGNRFYVEPYAKFGYPYRFGAGVSAGVRF